MRMMGQKMWKTEPKIELHLHLDCSLSYLFVQAFEPNITLDAYRKDFVAPAKCKDLAEFLTYTRRSLELMQTEFGLRLAAQDVVRQLLEDRVIYAEIRYAPLLHVQQGLSGDDVVAIVSDELLKQRAIHPSLETRLLLCTLRHFTTRQSQQTADLVWRHAPKGVVVGIDIAGDEANFPLDAHAQVFDQVFARHIPITAHAGESKGPESVWETLKKLHPSRLGHGIRSWEDKNLISYLISHRIHLEVCPSSNIQTAVYGHYSQHPVNRLFKAGVSLSINTDGRALNNISLGQEYDRLHQIFGWTKREFRQCNVNALKAAFIAPDLRQRFINFIKNS